MRTVDVSLGIGLWQQDWGSGAGSSDYGMYAAFFGKCVEEVVPGLWAMIKNLGTVDLGSNRRRKILGLWTEARDCWPVGEILGLWNVDMVFAPGLGSTLSGLCF